MDVLGMSDGEQWGELRSKEKRKHNRYLKLENDDVPPDQKTFAKLDEDFHQTFVPRDLEDQAWQEVYSLSMEQFKGDFDQYASAFWLA